MTNAERQRAYRERKRNGATVTDVTRNAVTRPEDLKSTALVRSCANCESLAAEVAALKRQLRERAPEVVVIDAPRSSGRRRDVSEAAKSQNDNKHTMTPHGPHCQGVCCKYGRRAE